MVRSVLATHTKEAPLGDALLDLVSSAQRELVLCAPFVKRMVVEHLMERLEPNVDLTVYTRWRPEEVSAGVSDVEVLDVVEEFGGRVFLHNDLHAKFFRTEAGALLGSANLTATALGWSSRPNLELLIDADLASVEAIETVLSNQSVQATPEMAQQVQAVADCFDNHVEPECTITFSPLPESGIDWLPQLRHPEDLIVAYKKGEGALSTKSGNDAANDLAALDIPRGMEAELFSLIVGARLLQVPFFADLDQFLDQRRRFGELRNFVRERAPMEPNAATQSTQTVMRWLLEFLPDRYETSAPNWAESLQRRRKVMN